MCNSARRQERVCKAQRPAAKIDAIATQPAAETARPAFEPAGRLVDLNLAVFMCNSVARQERVCRAQRPAAKIDAIATSASGRDRTSAFEPAETPANCGLFLRDRETSVRGREDSNYVPGMQFCRTSLRRGQERSSEGRP